MGRSAKRALRNPAKKELSVTPEEANERQVPTYGDVLKHLEYERQKMVQNGEANIKELALARLTAKKVAEIWNKASLPVISDIRIVMLITKHHAKFRATEISCTGWQSQ